MDFLVLCPGNVKNKTDEKAQKKRGRNHVTRLINKEGTGIINAYHTVLINLIILKKTHNFPK